MKTKSAIPQDLITEEKKTEKQKQRTTMQKNQMKTKLIDFLNKKKGETVQDVPKF